MMTFPPRRTDSKNAIFIFCLFLGLGHLRDPGVSLVTILGFPSIEPLWGGGVLARGLYRPPSIESPSTPADVNGQGYIASRPGKGAMINE